MHQNIRLGDVPPNTDRELYVRIVIAAFQSLLSNPTLIDRLITEDSLAISGEVDFDPWQNRVSYLAIELGDALVRRLVD